MKKLTLLLSFSLISFHLFTQVPEGFNYQAIARDLSSQIIPNTELEVRIAILSDTVVATVVWEEQHTVNTNSFGLMTLVIGVPSATKVDGTAATFGDIDWTGSPLFIRTSINNGGWYNLGSARLWSVPYAMVSDISYNDLSSPFLFNDDTVYILDNFSVGSDSPMGAKLSVTGSDDLSGDALFEVKRNDGQTVFAVYPEGVRVYLPTDPLTKGPKGGFAIGGFDRTKGLITEDYMYVTPDSIRMYIDKTPDGKGPKGGFAIGGFDRTKAIIDDYIVVNADSTRIYIDDTDVAKGPKGGFAIGGFDRTKASRQDYMKITMDSTRFYIDDSNAKGPKGGFAIGGFDRTKGNNQDYFSVSTDTSGIISPSENRILWYPLKNAFLSGKVLVENRDSVGTNSMATGYESKAIGDYSEAFGYQSVSRGQFSTSIGKNSTAQAENSVAIGNHSRADALNSFAIGSGALAMGINSYAFGSSGLDADGYPTGNTTALGEDSFAFGIGSLSTEKGSVTLGIRDTATGDYSCAMGYGSKSTGTFSFSLGVENISSGYAAVALGSNSKAEGGYSFAMGRFSQTNAMGAVAIGGYTIASGRYSFASGGHTIAAGESSVALGSYCEALGLGSIAAGLECISSKVAGISMGYGAEATDLLSIAIGDGVTSGGYSSVVIGSMSTASNNYSVSIGNSNNVGGREAYAFGSGLTANGDYSVALGHWASTNNHNGSFVYGDNSTGSVSASADNQFVVKASGGTIFYSNPEMTNGVQLAAGGGSWASVSDKNKKENYENVDKDEILKKLSGINIQSWNYKTQDPEIRHIGITAQDFYNNFGFGESDIMITGIDLSGLNMVAIQGLIDRSDELNMQLKLQQEIIEEKDLQIKVLEERLERIESLLEIND